MNSFQIKLIALILMTIDHIGEFLFPQCDLLGYIGRLSAPLFLYFMLEYRLYEKSSQISGKSVCSVGYNGYYMDTFKYWGNSYRYI